MEEPLQGGYVTSPVRVGDTVRRRAVPQHEDAGFVHRVLRHLEACGWTGAPRVLGVDDEGREVLTFIEGHVPWDADQPADIWSDASLARVAELVREFHDLTAGTPLAQGGEVVCHNDLSRKNTVYRGTVPVAFLDWDGAAAGRRVHDLAHVCWQWLLAADAPPVVDNVARRLRVLVDAYGMDDRSEIVDTILWWQDRCWRGIEAKANAGFEPMVRLREMGGVRWVQEDYAWFASHKDALESALR